MSLRAWLPLVLVASACASTPESVPSYTPTQSVMEVVAVLRLHIADDTYHFPPARDFTGKNVYRASLRRLESLEQIHRDKLGSGYLADVIPFAKARALERMGEFELARLHYERSSQLETPLVEAALEGVRVCGVLAEARALAPAPGDSPEEALATFDRRRSLLEQLRSEVEGSHYAHVVDEELERSDRALADHFGALSRLDPRLDAFALQQMQDTVRRHRQSKLGARHLLALADFYAELSRRYVGRNPPEALEFDPVVFDEYAFGATRVYEAVSHRDGLIEKLEATRKLEAFLAFTLQVYDERLP